MANQELSLNPFIPQLISETDHGGATRFNALSLQIVQDEIAKFRNLVKSSAPLQKKMAKGTVTNNLYIDYNTSYIKPKRDHIISIRFSMQAQISKGQAYHDYTVLNYNLDKGERIELSDLFLPGSNYLDVLSAYTSRVLQKRLPNQNRVLEGTSPRSENFQVWNIKPTGLLITFSQNQVAPALYGAQTILVPYDAFDQIISPDSTIADCIKHKTKCIRSNLLTGGFIDEAANTSHGSLNPILSQL